MKWITGITLYNYRAFANRETITIPKGQHTLIYGENGSGKSSIYNALKDFLQSSDDTSKHFEMNLFSHIAGNNTGAIQIQIADLDAHQNIISENTFTFGQPDAQSDHRVSTIRLANKSKGFIDYKRMLKTHYVDTPLGVNPNLFSLVVEDILSEHLIKRTSGGGVVDYELGKEWKRISESILNYDGRTRIHKYAVKALPFFEQSLKELLIQVFIEVKHIIREYFDPKLDINVNLSQIQYVAWRSIKKELYLNIKYAGKDIISYQSFLNEARLSALAISIYLAALKTYPQAASDLKVLYLDDIFIGLDTNNRIPLLNVLKKEFIDNGYQLFISTYDRQWFELARQWFENNGCKFKCFELFIEDNGDPNTPECPIVLPSEGNFAKAEAYFKAKDYPAAGSYLRKECEVIIKALLPDTYRITEEGDVITELEKLMQQLNQLYTDCGVAKPQVLIDSIKIYRKVLLNPTSHDDLKSPIFRKEIEHAFTLINQLKSMQRLDRRKMLDSDQILSINLPSVDYSMELLPCDNIFVTEYNGTKTLSLVKYCVQKWTYKSVDYGIDNNGAIVPMDADKVGQITSERRTLKEVFEGIKRSINIEIPADLFSAVTIGTKGTLSDLLK